MKITAPDGVEHEAIPVGIENSREQWNEYLCSDGTVLRIKLVMTQIYRVEGQFSNDGQPLYLVSSSNVLHINAPESMLKK